MSYNWNIVVGHRVSGAHSDARLASATTWVDGSPTLQQQPLREGEGGRGCKHPVTSAPLLCRGRVDRRGREEEKRSRGSPTPGSIAAAPTTRPTKQPTTPGPDLRHRHRRRQRRRRLRPSRPPPNFLPWEMTMRRYAGPLSTSLRFRCSSLWLSRLALPDGFLCTRLPAFYVYMVHVGA